MFRVYAQAISAAITPAIENGTAIDNGATIENGGRILFERNPSELAMLLEFAWHHQVKVGALGNPNHRSDLSALDSSKAAAFQASLLSAQLRSWQSTNSFMWDHLVYAYMIENTRLYPIFRRVLSESVSGENLGIAKADAQAWLRNTEELFFREPPHFSIWSVASFVRPDQGASRRNAYYRMFGMDLNHGGDAGEPISYVKPEASNHEFVSTFEDFLREVWVAYENVNNSIGPNPSDNQAIANHVHRLNQMLMARRLEGTLSREEFAWVSMMSWFHLTLEFDSPIVKSLMADGTSPEQRLFKIADRVQLPAHARAGDFFALAEPMSRLLIAIEQGSFSTAGTVTPLYTPGSAAQADISTIITHWTSATGRDIKTRRTPVLATRQ